MFGIAENTEFLTAIGINDAPEDVKAKLIEGIEDLVRDELIIEISDQVTEEQAEEFSHITDEQQAKTWLDQHIPDFGAIITRIVNEIKNDLLTHKTEIIGA